MDRYIPSSKALGMVLKNQRKHKKLTQTEAGRPFGLEQSTVSNLEKGASGVRLDTLFRMLAALDLEMVIRTKDKDSKGGWKEEW
jgi:HTH-type transcriptional regulator / antitoxin HipB